jgi:hypothetical protein
MKRLSLPWMIGVLAAALALLGTLRLYQQPDFLLTLADQLWSCF